MLMVNNLKVTFMFYFLSFTVCIVFNKAPFFLFLIKHLWVQRLDLLYLKECYNCTVYIVDGIIDILKI